MKYKEFTVTTTAEAEEIVADVFWNHTDAGVAVSSLKDVVDLTENKRVFFDYVDEDITKGDMNVSFVKGYFPVETADKDVLKVVADLENAKKLSCGEIDFGSLEIVGRVVDGEDWIEIWRKHFKVHEFSRVAICPEWLKYDGKLPEVLIGSNTAFGTGEHETTSMCIELLEKHVKDGDIVIDVGTGSGILGITSAKMGAAKVSMTDIDIKAVEAAEYNVRLNKVGDKCFPLLSNLVEGLDAVCDLVVANITAEILVLLADEISSYVKNGAVLIMSGILNDRVDKVVNAFSALGFNTDEIISRGEWTAVSMRCKK